MQNFNQPKERVEFTDAAQVKLIECPQIAQGVPQGVNAAADVVQIKFDVFVIRNSVFKYAVALEKKIAEGKKPDYPGKDQKKHVGVGRPPAKDVHAYGL